jgi:2-keto-4-pentenoate hydratase/2-oxohepta-3-ene-1,7-dioic acid hydratase in catechol pathway
MNVVAETSPAGVVLAMASLDGGEARPWLVANARALPLADWAADWLLARVRSLTELVEHWPDHRSGLRALTAQADTRDRIVSQGITVTALRLHAPIEPRQTFCTIGNYRRQVVEAALDADDEASEAALQEALDRRRRTGEPYVCLTTPQRIRAPFGDLTIPHGVDTLDWEVEIAVVIGASVRHATDETAVNAIAGYCVANDLTVRSEVTRTDLPALSSDWVRSKGMPGSLPLGPWFVPAWQISDTSRLRLRLSVNNTVMQDDTAEDMLFGIEHQIAYLSRHTHLRPGDVICTGSPAGFGSHHGRFLRDGDLVTAQVSGLGAQHLRCVQESR